MKQQDMDDQVQNMHDDLWIKIPDIDIEIGQRLGMNDYELIQEEYLRNFDMIDNIEKPQPPGQSANQDIWQMRHHSQIQRETKTDNCSKLIFSGTEL